jgi:DNA polymerase
MFYIDIETRSTLDLRKTGASRYARHPETEPILFAYAEGDGPVDVTHCLHKRPICPWQKGATIVAHNASFERHVVEQIMIPRYSWPKVGRWICTATRATSLALPRKLEDVAIALGLDVTKDKEGHALMMRMSRPRNRKNFTNVEFFEDEDRLTRLGEYCRRDVEVCRAIHQRLGPLSESEQHLYGLTEKINSRGLLIDIDAAAGAIELIGAYEEALVAELPELTDGLVTTINQRDRILVWLSDQGHPLENLTADTVSTALKNSLPPGPRRVLEIRQSLAKSSTKKLAKMIESTDHDGRARGCFVHHRASTGRWGGALIQPHNFPRGSYSPWEMADVLSACADRDAERIDLVHRESLPTAVSYSLRGLIVAPPGHDLIVSDFAGVEARGVAWAAGQQDLLQQFVEGVDTYVEMAAAIFRKSTDDVTKDERTIGKMAVLGCGYGLGPQGFVKNCQAQGVLHVDLELATRTVKTYRKVNNHIWTWTRKLQQAAVSTVDTGKPHSAPKARFWMRDDFLICTLPSRRELAYYQPEVIGRGTASGHTWRCLDAMTLANNQWVRRSIHAGVLTENVVSGFCRDLLAKALLNIEDHPPYRLVGHCHDEVIVEVPHHQGSVDEVKQLSCVRPSWAGDFPLEAAGFRCKRYQK